MSDAPLVQEFEFEASIQTFQLAEWIDQLGQIIDEARIEIDGDGFSVRAVDPANVGILDTTLPADAFENYEADAGSIGININRLLDLLEHYPDTAPIRIWNNDQDQLSIEFDAMHVRMATITPDCIRQSPDEMDLEFDTRVVCEAHCLIQMIDAAWLVADKINIGVDPDGTIYGWADGDNDASKVEYPADHLAVKELERADVQSKYSLDYLTDLSKRLDGVADVEIQFGSEYPITATYTLPESGAEVEYMQAPTIQTGGDDDGW